MKFKSLIFSLIPVLGVCSETEPTNVLLITADDLGCLSVGAYGSPVSNITPNIDRLAENGVKFNNAHVAAAVSQPSRGAMLTGRYPHNSGIEGFFQSDEENMTSIIDVLKDEGFYCAVMGKMGHSTPEKDTPWDFAIDREGLGMGRDSRIYYRILSEQLAEAKKQNKPFFLNVNSHDPHRPFHGSVGEQKMFKGEEIPQPSYIYTKDEITVPEFLPDTPNAREDLTQYYNSVKRLDDTVGAILDALNDSGELDNTLVIFLSDNGMSQPFSKANCYYQSTRTPLIVSSPKFYKEGLVDDTHLVSGIDIYPTIMEVLGIDKPQGIDGRSFLPLLSGETQSGRDYLLTQFHSTSARISFPMRAIIDREFVYIFNPWAIDGKKFHAESYGGGAYRGMNIYSSVNEDIAARKKMSDYRVLEEFYDITEDPNALNNIVNHPAYKKKVEKYREIMLNHLKEVNDPCFEAFKGKDNIDIIRTFNKDYQNYTTKRSGTKK